MPVYGPGIRTATPPLGLECTFSYNGLTFGDRTNPDRYRITSISGFDDADIRVARELLTNQDGEVAYPAYYGGRTISFRGVIEAGNYAKLRSMQDDLRSAFAYVNQEIPLYIYSPGSVTDVMFEKVKKSGPLQMAEQQTGAKISREFQITLRSSDPWMVSQTLTTTTVAAGSATTITNTGNYYAWPVITISGTSALTNPTVTIGGYFMGFTYVVPNGTTLIIDIQDHTVKNNSGAWMYSKFSSSADWPWPIIVPGSNAVSIAKSSGTGSVDIAWRTTWI